MNDAIMEPSPRNQRLAEVCRVERERKTHDNPVNGGGVEEQRLETTRLQAAEAGSQRAALHAAATAAKAAG